MARSKYDFTTNTRALRRWAKRTPHKHKTRQMPKDVIMPMLGKIDTNAVAEAERHGAKIVTVGLSEFHEAYTWTHPELGECEATFQSKDAAANDFLAQPEIIQRRRMH